jgi:hypothetical protein
MKKLKVTGQTKKNATLQRFRTDREAVSQECCVDAVCQEVAAIEAAQSSVVHHNLQLSSFIYPPSVLSFAVLVAPLTHL